MSVRLSELAELVGGQLSGDGHLEISGADILRRAGPGQITLADRPQLLEELARSRASAAVVSLDLQPQGKPYIAVDNVRAAFACIVARFRPPRSSEQRGISPQAYVSPSAKLAPDVTVHPFAYIGAEVTIGAGSVIFSGVTLMDGCQLGEQVMIFPRAVLYENTIVGHRVIIHANAVLGAFGFGYETRDGQHLPCSQLGNVVIEDDVEIGAGTTIDRGTFGSTHIGRGTKIDNLVMIGHNCQIGRHNLLCGQVGIAGSCTTGDYVVLAGQVGLRDHLELADGVVVGAQSGVSESLLQAGKYLGTPALPMRKAMQVLFAQQRLPEIIKRLPSARRETDTQKPANDGRADAA